MRLLHRVAKTNAVFDDPNLVSHAGLVPAVRLASNVGLEELVTEHVQVAAKVGANPGMKIGSLVAGMIAGADDIEGMDLLRHGALPATFSGIRAPSTLGSFLRAFTQATCASSRRGHPCCPPRRPWPSSMLTRCSDASMGPASRARRLGTPKSRRARCWYAPWARWWPWCPRRWPRRWSRPPGCAVVTPAPPAGRPAWWPKPSALPERPGPGASSWCAPTPPTTPGRSSPPAAVVGPASRSPCGSDPACHHQHRRGRLGADPIPQRHLRRAGRHLDLRCRDRRGALHRVRFPPRPPHRRAADRPAR
jgi:hypothetical protein